MIRRLLRWLFHLLAMISLLLWLFACALLVRSRTYSDTIWVSWHGRLLVLFPSVAPGAPPSLMWVERWDDVNESQWISRRRGSKYVSLVDVEASPIQLTSLTHEFLDLTWTERQSTSVYILRNLSQVFSGPGLFYPTRRLVVKNWRTPLVLFAMLPMAWATDLVIRHLMNRRRMKGLCRNCGYDLRATPERCPECGTVAESHMDVA